MHMLKFVTFIYMPIKDCITRYQVVGISIALIGLIICAGEDLLNIVYEYQNTNNMSQNDFYYTVGGLILMFFVGLAGAIRNTK